MAPKKPARAPRARTVARSEARQRSRDAAALAEALERRFAVAPGATPARAIPVPTPAVIEGRAQALACPRCAGELRVESHLVRQIEGDRVREVQVRCRGCKAARLLYFRIDPSAAAQGDAGVANTDRRLH